MSKYGTFNRYGRWRPTVTFMESNVTREVPVQCLPISVKLSPDRTFYTLIAHVCSYFSALLYLASLSSVMGRMLSTFMYSTRGPVRTKLCMSSLFLLASAATLPMLMAHALPSCSSSPPPLWLSPLQRHNHRPFMK